MRRQFNHKNAIINNILHEEIKKNITYNTCMRRTTLPIADIQIKKEYNAGTVNIKDKHEIYNRILTCTK